MREEVKGLFIILIFALVWGSATGLSYCSGVNHTMNEAHKRGFMEYCTVDGSRVWRGECPEDRPHD